jgi:hypothetical protein
MMKVYCEKSLIKRKKNKKKTQPINIFDVKKKRNFLNKFIK